MSRPSAPSMPTEKQVRDAHEIANKLCPGARIKGLGPEGVVFEYPSVPSDPWNDRPFGDGK